MTNEQDDRSWRCEAVPDEYSADEPVVYTVARIGDFENVFWFRSPDDGEKLAVFLNAEHTARLEAERERDSHLSAVMALLDQQDVFRSDIASARAAFNALESQIRELKEQPVYTELRAARQQAQTDAALVQLAHDAVEMVRVEHARDTHQTREEWANAAWPDGWPRANLDDLAVAWGWREPIEWCLQCQLVARYHAARKASEPSEGGNDGA